ncbi:MAG: hypothetical protein KDB03_04725 [Planctomycetales bacterium]|nr:hypothetical protein [Planctomycetales bacterium]
MPISDDDLIAYLLGDVTSEQTRRIEEALAGDQKLHDRLEHLREMLSGLDRLNQAVEPPLNLLTDTLAKLDAVDHMAMSNNGMGGSATNDRLNSSNSIFASSEQPQSLSSIHAHPLSSISRGPLDSTVLATCVAVVCCLILPALVRVRFESRKYQCADNLRATGIAMLDFANNQPSHRFPAVAVNGPEAFAGIFAIRLNDLGLIESLSQLQCASLPKLTAWPASYRLPSVQELSTLDNLQLERVQNTAGGSYAYSLGVIESEEILPPRCEGRSHFPILADAPIYVGAREEFVAHDGRGINILFEDGRVAFVVGIKDWELGNSFESTIGPSDYPFQNANGLHAVGMHPHDASLAPSFVAPLALGEQ